MASWETPDQFRTRGLLHRGFRGKSGSTKKMPYIPAAVPGPSETPHPVRVSTDPEGMSKLDYSDIMPRKSHDPSCLGEFCFLLLLRKGHGLSGHEEGRLLPIKPTNLLYSQCLF